MAKQISPHFTDLEFKCRHCGKLPAGMPAPKLLEKLEKLRERIGAPLHIASGYRCPKHNAAVGGAQNSQHPKGTAADITVKTLGPGEVADAAEAVFGYRSGIGRYPGFTHVDVRSSHARW